MSDVTAAPTTADARLPASGLLAARSARIVARALGVAATALGGAIALGWLAREAEAFAAPWLLFPLVIGASLGLLVAAAARWLQCGQRRFLLLLATIAGLLLVVSLHGFAYRQAARRAEANAASVLARQAFPEHAERLAVPTSPWQFMRQQAASGRRLGGRTWRGRAAWVTWALDAALVCLGALATVHYATQTPYCPRCLSWYRPVRSASVGEADYAALKTAVPALPETLYRRCQILACHEACGPFQFIAYGAGDERRPSGARVHVALLDAAARSRVEEVLDRSAASKQPQRGSVP